VSAKKFCLFGIVLCVFCLFPRAGRRGPSFSVKITDLGFGLNCHWIPSQSSFQSAGFPFFPVRRPPDRVFHVPPYRSHSFVNSSTCPSPRSQTSSRASGVLLLTLICWFLPIPLVLIRTVDRAFAPAWYGPPAPPASALGSLYPRPGSG